jgi:phosphoribosyl-AMP cyclohydrolase
MNLLEINTVGPSGPETVKLDFGEDGQNLIPAVVQEAGTGEVLLVAFMNREAYVRTVQTGKAHFWSRSRQTLWLKGETSGQFLLVQEYYVNCEENSLLLKVKLAGGVACHTGNKSCYYRRADWHNPEEVV